MSEDKENIERHANILRENYDQAEYTKYELMKILQDKEKLSLCLSDKLEQLDQLRMDNLRLRGVLDNCKRESQELISHGLNYLDSTQEETGSYGY